MIKSRTIRIREIATLPNGKELVVYEEEQRPRVEVAPETPFRPLIRFREIGPSHGHHTGGVLNGVLKWETN
jgi:hypothetical protein